ncbi:uncharacterized protein LOC128920246 [Zeugodacus cucurbitae]|uniref:uncharacterized protein LOC128920246 n=1 Tax=Zeugodacus cucurbitae TaxID=28588 RepID=UPI0023D8F09E|nr:uncharacterized protein LOC128920246 [Zeugodacus cucurbitae]
MKYCQKKQVRGMDSTYDNDCIEINVEDFDNTLELQNKTIKEDQMMEEEIDFEPWEHYTPMQLKTPKNRKLCPESVNKKHTSWAKLADIKKMKEEIEFTKIEHTLRVQQMKEAHELQQKFIIEKHVLEMRILEDQLKPK